MIVIVVPVGFPPIETEPTVELAVPVDKLIMSPSLALTEKSITESV